MHNRSFRRLPKQHADVRLDPTFPCFVHLHHPHTDRPITYLHGHDCLEIGHCHAGTGIFVIDGHVHPFSAGDTTVIAPSQMHLACSTEGTTSLWTWIYIDPVQLLTLPPDEQHVLSAAAFERFSSQPILPAGTDPALAELIRQIIDETQRNDTQSRPILRGLLCAAIAHLHRQLPTKRVRKHSPKRTSAFRRIEPILAHLASHYADDLTIDDLAARAHVSRATLRRLFQHALGQSPLEYLIGLRIKMACSLLVGTDRPIVAIAYDVGFATLSSFNRHFKTHTALSPRQWRTQGR